VLYAESLAKRSNIIMACGFDLPSITEIRYLRFHILLSRISKCSFDQAKRTFYRSLNAVFGRVNRSGSEEVYLVTQKFCRYYCMVPKPVF